MAKQTQSNGLAKDVTDRIGALLDQAHRIGGVSVYIFERNDDREGDALVGCGGASEACRYVSRLPWGQQACRRSRERAYAIATSLNRPAPYICHMGFACAATCVKDESGNQYALSLGPYCPEETPDALDRDALEGLQALSREPVTELPFATDDIPHASPSAIPELADWTAIRVRSVFPRPILDAVDDASALESPTRGTPNDPPHDPFQGADIAAALIGGDQDRARSLVRTVLNESVGGKRAVLRQKRARAVSLVGAVLEASERAGFETTACWDRFESFEKNVRSSHAARELVLACMKVLGQLKRSAKRQEVDAAFYQTLNKLLSQRIRDDVNLSDIAKILDVHPTAVTHRLQRKFGMSFSEYRGRIRVDMAKELLRGSQLKVREIAVRVGVDDTANFGKLFRKFERMSPTEYRSRYRNT